MFIGRQQELNILETKYKSNKAEFIVLYGRRRISKTETLKEFCFKNWFDAFSFIADYNSEEKIIVVIDEFPYVCKGIIQMKIKFSRIPFSAVFRITLCNSTPVQT